MRLNNQKGLVAETVILVGLLILTVAAPLTVNLVKQKTETRVGAQDCGSPNRCAWMSCGSNERELTDRYCPPINLVCCGPLSVAEPTATPTPKPSCQEEGEYCSPSFSIFCCSSLTCMADQCRSSVRPTSTPTPRPTATSVPGLPYTYRPTSRPTTTPTLIPTPTLSCNFYSEASCFSVCYYLSGNCEQSGSCWSCVVATATPTPLVRATPTNISTPMPTPTLLTARPTSSCEFYSNYSCELSCWGPGSCVQSKDCWYCGSAPVTQSPTVTLPPSPSLTPRPTSTPSFSPSPRPTLRLTSTPKPTPTPIVLLTRTCHDSQGDCTFICPKGTANDIGKKDCGLFQTCCVSKRPQPTPTPTYAIESPFDLIDLAPTPVPPLLVSTRGQHCSSDGQSILDGNLLVEECDFGCNSETITCNPTPGYLVCSDKELRCSGQFIQSCQENVWVNQKKCGDLCDQETLGCHQVCEPLKYECANEYYQRYCKEDGSSWEMRYCEFGCGDNNRCYQAAGIKEQEEKKESWDEVEEKLEPTLKYNPFYYLHEIDVGLGEELGFQPLHTAAMVVYTVASVDNLFQYAGNLGTEILPSSAVPKISESGLTVLEGAAGEAAALGGVGAIQVFNLPQTSALSIIKDPSKIVPDIGGTRKGMAYIEALLNQGYSMDEIGVMLATSPIKNFLSEIKSVEDLIKLRDEVGRNPEIVIELFNQEQARMTLRDLQFWAEFEKKFEK